MAVATTATYTDTGAPWVPQVPLSGALFALVALPCSAAWAALGVGAGRLLDTPGRMRAFDLCMAVLLLASVVPGVVG